MEYFLTTKGLWEAVTTDDAPVADCRKARAIIGLCVTSQHLATIQRSKTAKEAWDSLAAIFKTKGTALKLRLRRDLSSFKMAAGEPLTKYFARAKALQDKLLESFPDFKEEDIFWPTVQGLPSTYDTILTIIENTADAELTLDSVLPKLMQVEQRQRGPDRLCPLPKVPRPSRAPSRSRTGIRPVLSPSHFSCCVPASFLAPRPSLPRGSYSACPPLKTLPPACSALILPKLHTPCDTSHSNRLWAPTPATALESRPLPAVTPEPLATAPRASLPSRFPHAQQRANPASKRPRDNPASPHRKKKHAHFPPLSTTRCPTPTRLPPSRSTRYSALPPVPIAQFGRANPRAPPATPAPQLTPAQPAASGAASSSIQQPACPLASACQRAI